jgi:hypothetical protein
MDKYPPYPSIHICFITELKVKIGNEIIRSEPHKWPRAQAAQIMFDVFVWQVPRSIEEHDDPEWPQRSLLVCHTHYRQILSSTARIGSRRFVTWTDKGSLYWITSGLVKIRADIEQLDLNCLSSQPVGRELRVGCWFQVEVNSRG